MIKSPRFTFHCYQPRPTGCNIRLPSLAWQIIDLDKVSITSDQYHMVLPGNGRDPNVVVGDGAAFKAQGMLDRAVSPGHIAIAIQDDNLLTEFFNSCRFSEARLDLRAPKTNSPRTMLGRRISSACANWAITAASPLKNAMTMLVSSRKLPLTLVHLLAALLDGFTHLTGIFRRDRPGQMLQVTAGRRTRANRHRLQLFSNRARQSFQQQQALLQR